MCDNNFKKLLCYNTIKNIPCTYKSKCLFAHNLEEQQKDLHRDFIYKMIIEYDDLSHINIYENVELFDNLIVYTHECKKCIDKQCSGSYNCKYGACLTYLKICYNDLIYGKCSNDVINGKCICGHHLTEKNLIPYNQYEQLKNINIKDINMNDITNNINRICQIKTCFVIELNDDNIKNIKNIINFNNNK